ncbi:peptide ABC transporter substrate-binding protein [Janibacter cremeus]|uniref:Oligopeptide transport system substrate-binding protein n=1 Tax=Janibacter cremeus TaxID=1285192 RepID=A0A852VKF2_9MICO|nr:ABC transporter substrate-binding protein [Janibacter cremeus]NYF97532.1 oligopeptide transport system substrate-binding protein [Janibacter cremeus]
MAIASISAVALLATACGGSSDDSSGGGGDGGSGGEIVVNGCTPENPLVAGNTGETCGGNVLDTITAKLIHYDSETAEPSMDIAESIETDDNQNFTVKLKDYKFQDGTDVTAENFVKAWNYTAYGPNAQQGSYFFAPIKGYDEIQCSGEGDDPCAGDGEPDTKKMSGLKVVDDKTFTIETTEKVSNLPLRLGYSAFAPQPDVFFDDPEAFGQEPVAAGPYKFDSWEKNKAINLSKFDDYSGEFGGQVDKITFKIFKEQEAAYTALLGGQIDIIDALPANALIGDKFKSDLGEGHFLEQPNSTSQWIGTNPKVSEKLSDVNVRRAISMAIDRETIIKQIFNGAYEPSTGVVSPVVDGFKEGQCGEYCSYDPEKAKELLEKGGGYEGKLALTYNGDGGHKEWTEAVCNSVKNAIGIDCVATPTVDFATMLTDLGDNELKGLWRMGWVMDYPSIENYLAPIFSKGAASNYYQYDNPEFQKLLKQAAAADDADEANKLYQEAERVLSDDMVAIPLWYGKSMMGWSDDVDDVKADPFGNPVLADVTLK